jgi:hypothetical protein
VTGQQISGEIFDLHSGNYPVVLDDPFGIEVVNAELRDGDIAAIK